MKLKINQPAPDFTVTDASGNEVSLRKLRGNKIYLAFERNVGCPVCNLHFHELSKRANYFSENRIKVILVYESPREKLTEYLNEVNYPFYFVPDPRNELYIQYSVERSFMKLLKGLTRGLLPKAMAGTKLFSKPMKQDGHTATIPAEFIIDERGNLSVVHYGDYLGDHLPLSAIQ
jgi:peroxiredoxin Q/BCP